MFSSEFFESSRADMRYEAKISELNLTLKEKTSLLSEFRAREIVSSAKTALPFPFSKTSAKRRQERCLTRFAKKADCAVLVFAENSRINYVLGAAKNSPFDCKYLCEILNGLYGGKGGGSKAFASRRRKFLFRLERARRNLYQKPQGGNNMNYIVCVDKNWGIGKGGDLLFSLPSDMKFFRETTSGKTVVMGRKTLLSSPAGGRSKIGATSC